MCSHPKPKRRNDNDGCFFQIQKTGKVLQRLRNNRSSSSSTPGDTSRVTNRPGRPSGSSNVALDSLVSEIKEFALPWCIRDFSFDPDGTGPAVYNAGNTCAMDTFLMGMAILCHIDAQAKEYVRSCGELWLAIDCITNRGPNIGRISWIHSVLLKDIDSFSVLDSRALFPSGHFTSFDEASGRPLTTADTLAEPVPNTVTAAQPGDYI